mmetsp:Transcript_439/g.1337  ORF Transcript_439/g.1337 Transcript_439/m.1337 type:complete len:341 (+) Transcript_439:1-1023(+)
MGSLSGLTPGDASALAGASLWLRRRGRPHSAMLPMGFGALCRRAPAGAPASASARWAEGGKQIVLTASVDIAPGEEVVLPQDLVARLRDQEAGDQSSDTSGPEHGDVDRADAEPAAGSGDEEPEDWDAIEAALQEQGDESSEEEAAPPQPACIATEEWYRELARRQLAEQEARARQEVWSPEPSPGAVLLLPPEAGVTAGAVRAGRSRVHGLGVFALLDFAPEGLVEICPALLLDEAGRVALADYAMSFEAAGDGGVSANGLPQRLSVVALGCGALYNHREVPNAAWAYLPDVAGGVVVVTALRQIAAGEELFISYGAGYWQGRSAPEMVGVRDRVRLLG